MLGMPKIRVLEVATFYTMFNLSRSAVSPRATVRHHAMPAARRRGDQKGLRKRIGEPVHVSADGAFSWSEVECLGACCNAPMVLISKDTYEDLTPENFANCSTTSPPGGRRSPARRTAASRRRSAV